MNYKNIIFKSGFLVFLFSIFFLFGSTASAGSTCNCKNSSFSMPDCTSCQITCASNGGFDSCEVDPPSLGTVTPKPPDVSQVTPQVLPNPLGITDVNTLIARLINFVLSLVGSVSLLMFVYGGLTWMTSAGSPDKIKKGRDIIVWAIIGLAIVFTSYILVKFVIVGLAG